MQREDLNFDYIADGIWKQGCIQFAIFITDYTPGREAPHTADRGNPDFSDPGDDETIDYQIYFKIVEVDGTEHLFQLPDEFYNDENFADEVLDAALEIAREELL